MMNTGRQWIRIIILAVLVLGLLIGIRSLEWFLPSFPGLLLGQIQLNRDSAPLSPLDYQSAEFVLGEVEEGDIERANYIYLQDDVLFWDPHYPGFPRTELSLEEVRQIQDALTDSEIVKQDNSGFVCLDITTDQVPEYRPCSQGPEIFNRFNDYRFQAYKSRDVGVLLIELRNGGLVEIRISPGENGMAFEPREKSGPWWMDGVVDQPLPLLDELADRVEVEPIPVLWPWMGGDQANAKARRILGKYYQRAYDALLISRQVREVFGEIQEIRPAEGINSYSSWMDSCSATMTFYVSGSAAEGVVLAQGEYCFQLQMVVDGVPARVIYEEACP